VSGLWATRNSQGYGHGNTQSDSGQLEDWLHEAYKPKSSLQVVACGGAGRERWPGGAKVRPANKRLRLPSAAPVTWSRVWV
jgi:hypothetical protein